MKIATFNINNINTRLANLLAWLRSAKPDVVCLQELKATDREFPHVALANAGYGAVACIANHREHTLHLRGRFRAAIPHPRDVGIHRARPIQLTPEIEQDELVGANGPG